MFRHSRLENERGAVIIHVAIALIALLAFTAIVVDHGVMTVARAQAQNAADAGALGGALSLMNNASDTAGATSAAIMYAGQQHAVWGANTAATDILVSPLPFACPASAGGGNACIRVDVVRGLVNSHDGSTHTNTIPTYLAGIFGLASQGVRATATAQVAAGNAVMCIKPWVVADKWIDQSGTGSNTSGWDQNDFYNPGVDDYSPPGFKADDPNDYGLQLVLKEGQNGVWSSGWTMEIDLGASGSNVYRDEIEGCPTWVPTVGLYNTSVPCSVKTDENPEKGCIGVKTGMSQGPTRQGVTYLTGLDSSASWNITTNALQGGCTDAGNCYTVNPTGMNLSPRIVPLALFNVPSYAASPCSGTNCVAKVVNLLGFFIEGMCDDVYPDPATRPSYCGTPADAGKSVVGRLMAYPGQASGAAGSAGPETFLKITRLVR